MVTSKFATSPLPDNFEKYDVPSSFLANFWGPLATLLLFGILLLLSCFVTKCVAKSRLLYRVCAKIERALKWNFLLSLFTSYYGNIVFYSSLEFRTSTDSHSSLGVLSLIMCILVNISTLLIFAKIILIIGDVRKSLHFIRSQQQSDPSRTESFAETSFKHYTALFETYKSSSWSQQSFLLIYIARVCLYNLILAYLFAYPLAQAVAITTVNLAMLLYVLLKTPMKSRVDQVQYVLQELVLFIVNICVILFALTDRYNIKAINRAQMDNVVVWSNTAFGMLSGGYSIVKMLIQVIELYKRFRVWFKAEDKRVIKMEPLDRTQQGVDFQVSADGKSGISKPQVESSFAESSYGQRSILGQSDISLIHNHSRDQDISIKQLNDINELDECSKNKKKTKNYKGQKLKARPFQRPQDHSLHYESNLDLNDREVSVGKKNAIRDRQALCNEVNDLHRFRSHQGLTKSERTANIVYSRGTQSRKSSAREIRNEKINFRGPENYCDGHNDYQND